ncbi:MAG: glycosyltransferase family 4 protein [Micromonosporaceae bacterium]
MREYLLTLLVAAAMTYLLTPLVRRGAVAVGALPQVRDRDVHAVPTPRLGGLAMYGGLVAAVLVASRLAHMKAVFDPSQGQGRDAASLLLAGALIVATGFVDDRWGMSATGKLAAQVAAGGILIWGGVELDWFPMPKGSVLSLSSRQGIALTILLVVLTINAVNFIDGLDGLAAGVVGIAAFAFFIYSYELTRVVGLSHQSLPALVSAILAGMCLGFLPHNFYPARIFMGDTGSMLIGLVLAYATISSTADLDPATLQHFNRFPLLLPLLIPGILAIPYADLLLAVIRRYRAGMSVFAADTGHLHHRLLNIGHSHRLSVLILYLWAALFAFTVVMLSIVGSALAVLSVATVGAVLALLLVSMPWLRARRSVETRHEAGAGQSPPRRRHAAPPRRPSRARKEEPEAPAGRPEAPAGQPSGTVGTGADGVPRFSDTTSGKGLTKSL